jgi:hypothetical protein
MSGATATCAGSFDCDIIGGYLGVYPGTSITGNFDGEFVGKISSTADGAGCAADGLAAWKKARSEMTNGQTMLAEMGGETFIPGVYTHESSINVASNKPKVYLDAKGDSSAVFIFNVGSTLTTCADSEIVLQNEARAENVFWVLGTALTMGADSILVGNVLAGSAITVGTNAKILGRAIAQTAMTCETACTIETSGRHSAAPSAAPSAIPSGSPSSGPSSSPSATPSAAPSAIPSGSPSSGPSSSPSAAPSAAPSVAPSAIPSGSPSSGPSSSPSAAPSVAPSAAPSAIPSGAPSSGDLSMESMVVTKVGDSKWKRVSLSAKYVSPIAVCTVEYGGTGKNLLPAVVRMQNVKGDSFEIRLQRPNGGSLGDAGRNVHCVVVEEGSWKMPDGRKIEANKYVSTVTDNKWNSWSGEKQDYTNSYKTPVVLGQVMSSNDERWSVFWSRGLTRDSAPDKDHLFTGKHIGEDKTGRKHESVGYIVIEKGHAKSEDIEIETARGRDIVVGYVQKRAAYKFAQAFETKPAVAVLSQVGMDGMDGSWAVSAAISSTEYMRVAVDEDQISNPEREHTTEEVDYIVFSTAGPVQLYSN